MSGNQSWFDAIFAADTLWTTVVDALKFHAEDLLVELRRRDIVSQTLLNQWADKPKRDRIVELFAYLDATCHGDNQGPWLGALNNELSRLPGLRSILRTPRPTPSHNSRLRIPIPAQMHGREDDLERLVQLCTRIQGLPVGLPICGVGGQGKTTLALHVLRHDVVKERYGLERYFVSCESRRTAEQVAHAMCDQLGIGCAAVDEAGYALVDYLDNRVPRIIVLDNFEDAAQGADGPAARQLLRELLQCEMLALIVTMRGESPSLDTDRWRPPVELGGVDPDSAYEIFRTRAPRLRLPLMPVEGQPDADIIERFAAAVGYHPLCLLLVASRCNAARSLTIAAELAGRNDLQALRAANNFEVDNPRHSSLAICLSASYDSDTVTDDARRLLYGLSFLNFRHGIAPGVRHDLAEIFVGLGSYDDALDALVQVGLANLADWDEGRWRDVDVLPSIRRFALGQAVPEATLHDVWLWADAEGDLLYEWHESCTYKYLKAFVTCWRWTSNAPEAIAPPLPQSLIRHAAASDAGRMRLSRYYRCAAARGPLIVRVRSLRAAVFYGASVISDDEWTDSWLQDLLDDWAEAYKWKDATPTSTYDYVAMAIVLTWLSIGCCPSYGPTVTVDGNNEAPFTFRGSADPSTVLGALDRLRSGLGFRFAPPCRNRIAVWGYVLAVVDCHGPWQESKWRKLMAGDGPSSQQWSAIVQPDFAAFDRVAADDDHDMDQWDSASEGM